ncbi:hypothetical protein Pmar_PMAR000932 [Perkinsus marinus ATCC 50983]|uniref:Uncharacterized protein n=1 Tax=Perkinsus marinus (strain ATCC 50983 / TXsc) TaxID=423536 RepID=C5KNY4_PERM5|nr:hypothetical protein Pmar_PMAR000932 [Perkinsus marinus ATCC 50983]EER13772.1 hypothetical protein Pmar_PMAR000932 [Perkinsus marinus ATCC 50983]|eukprot:XP_002781977.1 hypothetical protein Pmar_PMAR000932 [Perkinsus marinus ATCC 50983]
MISYAFAGVPPFAILTPEITQSVTETFEQASTKVQEHVEDFKKTSTGQRISAAANSASGYMFAAFDSFLNRTEELVDRMLPPLEEPADMVPAEEESDATATSPSCSTKENVTEDQKPNTAPTDKHQGEVARALALAGAVCSRVYTRVDLYVIEPSRDYMADIWEFWSFVWSGAKELSASVWESSKNWFTSKYSELKEKAPGVWQYVKGHAAGCWEWLKDTASSTFTKSKEYLLCLKNKVVDIYNRVLTPERRHRYEEMYKSVSVKVYEYSNLTKDAIIKTAKSVYGYLVTVFTWDNFNSGVSSVSAAFACPWACVAAAKEEEH